MSMAKDLVKALISIAAHAPASIQEREMSCFLDQLTGHEIRGVLALVLIGRKRTKDFPTALRQVDEEVLEKLTAKAQLLSEPSLALHLRLALTQAEESGLDLDRYLRIRSRSQRRTMAFELA